jgi:hypothetical protein
VSDDPIFVGLMRSLRADPADSLTRAALANRLEESGREVFAQVLRAGRVPLTGLDELAVAGLHACRFVPGTFAKRFARTVYDRIVGLGAEGRVITLSPKQYALLWKLCRQYRRQIRDQRVLAEAEAVHALRQGLPPPAVRPAQGELPLTGDM